MEKLSIELILKENQKLNKENGKISKVLDLWKLTGDQIINTVKSWSKDYTLFQR